MKIGQEVLIHGYVDEIRKDVVIIRNRGGYFGTAKEEIIDYPDKPETGYWIATSNNKLWKCSKCGESSCCHSKFCNECGSKMEGVRE